jgi:AcrR family transcriptional regulator
MNDIAAAAGIQPGSLYTHFPSKEEIAVGLLEAFNADLAAISEVGLKEAQASYATPEEVVRGLVHSMTDLSMRHAAAVRLRAYEAPTAATERFRTLVNYQPPSLSKAWRVATDIFASGPHNARVDLRLLRFTFDQATLAAASYFPGQCPKPVSRLFSDMQLTGIAVACPEDAALDASSAMTAAQEVTAQWAAHRRRSNPDKASELIAVARAIFARRGFEATTVRDVAEAAGVRMGTLYRRVSSKDHLLRVILEDYSNTLTAGFETVLSSGSPAIEVLDAIAYLCVHAERRFNEEARVVKLGSGGMGASPDTPMHDYFLQSERRRRSLEHVVEQGQRSGYLRDIATSADVVQAARCVFWLPYQDVDGAGRRRTHQYLRESVFRGACASR